MVVFDLEKMAEKELVELNHQVIARLRFLRESKAHQVMLDFRMGEKVCFTPPGEKTQQGILIRFNRKSVTVLTDDGRRWTVPPVFLSKFEDDRVHRARAVDEMGSQNKEIDHRHSN